MLKLTRLFLPFFLIFLVSGFAAAQDALPVVTQTKAVTDLKTLLPTAENRQPVLINFWATWCGPCRVEFPDLVKIDADYRAKGLNFVLVSVDDAAVIETRVPEFLEEYASTMPSYLLALAGRRAMTQAVRRIAPRFPDAYPVTLLFDGRGRLVYQKVGVVDAKILRAQIDKVLNLQKLTP